MGRRPKARRAAYGAWLHHLRVEKGLSQQEVADFIGVRRSTVSYWERTGKLVGRETVLRMASVFGISVTKLLRVDRALAARKG